MFDLLGRETAVSQKFSMTKRGIEVKLTRNNLPSGIYYYQIKKGNELLGTGKLVAE